MRASKDRLAGWVVLSAEATVAGNKLLVTRVNPDFRTLGSGTGKHVGLALRVSPYPGPFLADGPVARRLADLAASLAADARARGIHVSELQLDFDCARSRLSGYARWLRGIRARLGPTRLTITALPDWLETPEFTRLVGLTDGYVLQVHALSITRPGTQVPAGTCDPAQARRAVERAGVLGVPYWVALPTYGYRVVLDAKGQVFGLEAEQPQQSWPAGARQVEVRSDPIQLARLVRHWTASRPAALAGILWYRLPRPGDRRNWSWTTLAAVMRGEEPRPALRAEVRAAGPGLYDIVLRNDGRADAILDRPVRISHGGADLIALDGLGGFEQADGAERMIRFAPRRSMRGRRLRPGHRQTVAWIRLSRSIRPTVRIEGHSRGTRLQ